MVDEMPSDEQATEAPAQTAAPEEDRGDHSGPGFLRGVILGAIIGAVAAVLLAPKADQEPASNASAEQDADAAVTGLRARLSQATAEARRAALEAEQAKRARLKELIERDQQ